MLDEKARKWAEKIIAVRSGQLTATDAARELNVSRKTYYEKENRALTALAEALQDQAAGRPAQEPDEEKENLQKKVQELEEENLLLRSSLRIRDVMREAETGGEKKGSDSDDHA
jgi:DNA-binding XRE family transcriptional regulator